jgi:hypothetical protein
MTRSAVDRRTRRTTTSGNARRRAFPLLAVVGAAVGVTLMSQPVAATQPEPPAESAPTEASTTAPRRHQ